MNDADRIKFLETVIDELMRHMRTYGGDPFISRAAFNEANKLPGAPKDYSYDEYVMDCIGD